MACYGGDEGDGYSLFSTDNQYGEKYQYDPDFKGPKSRRSATDVHWLVAFLVFTTVWLTFGLCVLLHDTKNPAQVGDVYSPDTSTVFEYLKDTLWCYLGPIIIATVICLVLIYVMRWIATPVVWFSIFLLVAVFLAVAIEGFAMYFENEVEKPHDESNGLILGIIFTIITIILVAAIYFLRQKIFVAIALIKEGSKAVASSYSTVFFPIIPMIFQICIFAIFSSVLVNIQLFVSRDDSGIQVALHILNVCGFIWACYFIDAFEKMVLAHAFSTWYWTLDKRNLPFFTLTTAIARTTRYHLGTIALGSALMALMKLICYMIKAMMNNRYMQVFRLCCNITDIIDRLLQYLNLNTYIMVAIHGNPFCKSMRDAVNLLMRNIESVYVTNKVTSIQFAIFNIAIATGMGGLTYLFLPKDVHTDLIQYPIYISVIGSLLVSATFFGVYSIAIDTMFLCFLEDIERNDGTEQRPYYMSQALMKVLYKNSDNLILPPPYEHL